MRRNPKVTLFAYDLSNTLRFIEVRGEVEVSEEGALEHLDEITRQYTNHPCYYGFIYPEVQKEKETRIICKMKPTKINLDAIHK